MTAGNFWKALDRLAADSRLVIDRPQGSTHPRYPDLVYPFDYGFLENITAMDGGGIDALVLRKRGNYIKVKSVPPQPSSLWGENIGEIHSTWDRMEI